MRTNQPIAQGWSRIAIFFVGNKQLSKDKKSQLTPYQGTHGKLIICEKTILGSTYKNYDSTGGL